MYRFQSRVAQLIIDLGVLSIAFWAAYFLRFDGDIPYQYFKRALFLWPYVTILQYLGLLLLRIPRFSWRYIGLWEVTRIGIALGTVSSILLGARLYIGAFHSLTTVAGYLFLPIGVIVIDFAIAFLGITGVRVFHRMSTERAEARRGRRSKDEVPTLIIGAGRAGILVAKEIQQRSDLEIRPVGFVDDDRSKTGTFVHGLRVMGTTAKLPQIVQKTEAQQAIIAIAKALGKDILRISQACDKAGLPAKIIPGIYEILDGRVNLAQLREVSIEDLLRRDVVQLDSKAVLAMVRDKRVIITGAGGSIGSELCRQVARLAPSQLVLLEQAEYSLYEIHRELSADRPGLDLVPCLADICDTGRIEEIFSRHTPHLVFHAAAHKHVPMLEWNPTEAVKNNIVGTLVVAEAADRHTAEAFVDISTDKAVNPTSIMGTTKRVAEMIVQAMNGLSKTEYIAVRFGNVLGSTGSVVPLFKEQIAAGGPVTVTHPEMRRYFMTIPEATQLVLQAAALGKGGEVLVLDMGEPIKIYDLASDLIRLSGLEPGEDIPVTFTGVRPGEKLFEELGFDPTTMERTRHPKIFVVKLEPEPWERLTDQIDTLVEAVSEGIERETLREILGGIVPEMQPDARTADELAQSATPRR